MAERVSSYSNSPFDTGQPLYPKGVSGYIHKESNGNMQPSENEIRNCVNSIPQTELFELLDVIKLNHYGLSRKDLSKFSEPFHKTLKYFLLCNPKKRISFSDGVCLYQPYDIPRDISKQIKEAIISFLIEELVSKRIWLHSDNSPYADYHPYDSRTLSDTLPRTIQFPLHDKNSSSNSSIRSSHHRQHDEESISEVTHEPEIHAVMTKDPHSHRRENLSFSNKLDEKNELFRSLQPGGFRQQKTLKTPNNTFQKRKGDSIEMNRKQPKELFLRTIDIDLLEPWGKTDFIGITGLEVILEDGSSLHLGIHKDTFLENASISENSRGLRYCHVLFPYTESGKRRIHIPLQRDSLVKEIKIYNYTENVTKLNRGVKFVNVYLNDTLLGNGRIFVLKAPSRPFFDYAQIISVTKPVSLESLLPRPVFTERPFVLIDQDYLCPVYPCGSIITFHIHSNWGDRRFFGLDSIRLLDVNGCVIDCRKRDVHFLSYRRESSGKFVDYKDEENAENGHSYNLFCFKKTWKSPIFPKREESGIQGSIYVAFQTPIIISCIKIWNYREIPTCGVKSVSILLDNNVIYAGELKRNDEPKDDFQSILFTNNDSIVRNEKQHIYHSSLEGVVFVDNNESTSLGGSHFK